MYLMKSLEIEDGSRHDMAGVFEGVASMKHIRTIGYVAGRFAMDTPIGQEGALFKGHEFHHSVITDLPSNTKFACRLDRGLESRTASTASHRITPSLPIHIYMRHHMCHSQASSWNRARFIVKRDS